MFACPVVLACGAAGAQPAPPPVPPPAASAAIAAPVEAARDAAIHQYRHDLIAVGALRDDAQHLLGVALLAAAAHDATPGLDFDRLSPRAVAAPNAGPAATWARLGLCPANDCPSAAALAALQQQAADNAAVWILALDAATRAGDAAAARAAFDKAAAASRYDDYHGVALAALVAATATLPPLPATTQGARGDEPDNPDAVRMSLMLEALEHYPRPDLAPVAKMCAPVAISGDAVRRAGCLRLAHVLRWGSSPAARALGLRLGAELEPATAADSAQSERDLATMEQQYSALLLRARTDPALAARWLATAGTGGTELSLLFATLRTAPPPGS